MGSYVLISMIFGVVTEACARVLKLWVYREPQTLVLNVIVVFGLVMGAIAMQVPRSGMLPAFAIGFTVGLMYEVANLAFLKWWDFPGQQLGFIRGHAAIVLVMSVLWGILPVLTAKVHAALPRNAGFGASRQSAMEKLTDREQVLVKKLDTVRQREHELESRLEDVHRRKQLVLDRQTARAASRPAARPTQAAGIQDDPMRKK